MKMVNELVTFLKLFSKAYRMLHISLVIKINNKIVLIISLQFSFLNLNVQHTPMFSYKTGKENHIK